MCVVNVCQSETSFNGDVRGEGPVQRKGKVKNIIAVVLFLH